MVQYQQLDQTFAALADPTRRDVLERLGRGGATITELAAPYGISLTGMNTTTTNDAPNLTSASVPLTLMGKAISEITSHDNDKINDLADIKQDIPYIASLNAKQIDWRWYQNGYGIETYGADASGVASHAGYVSHHQGPQYFGYLANNPALRENFRSESDFFKDIERHDLPESGVFYIRGGFYNIKYPNVTPPIQNKTYPNTAGLTSAEIRAINITKSGDDDHPAYADRQISESAAARIINAIAQHPDIWRQSAIIITYDKSDGYYHTCHRASSPTVQTSCR